MSKILIVDDDAAIRTLIGTAMELAGHDVSEAEDGTQALRKLRRRRYDLVLLDIMLPGIDGYEVLESIREMPSRSDMPVVVLTARHDPHGLAREIAAGATDHLAKPFLPSELERAVERALDEADNDGHTSRRRILGTDAEIYGSVQDLVNLARTAS